MGTICYSIQAHTGRPHPDTAPELYFLFHFQFSLLPVCTWYIGQLASAVLVPVPTLFCLISLLYKCPWRNLPVLAEDNSPLPRVLHWRRGRGTRPLLRGRGHDKNDMIHGQHLPYISLYPPYSALCYPYTRKLLSNPYFFKRTHLFLDGSIDGVGALAEGEGHGGFHDVCRGTRPLLRGRGHGETNTIHDELPKAMHSARHLH